MKWLLIIFTFIGIGIWIPIASWLDALYFFDPKRKKQVVEEFPKGITFNEVVKKFFWINCREGTLFLGGFLGGLLVMGVIS